MQLKTYSIERTVTPNITAKAVGSGSLDVLGTPMLIAMAEEASAHIAQSYIDDTKTTVGTQISCEHNAPTPLDATVLVVSTLIEHNDKSFTFEITATDNKSVIGKLTHTRFVVDVEKFMSKANSRLN